MPPARVKVPPAAVRSAVKVDKSNVPADTVRFPATPMLATRLLIAEPEIMRFP